MTKTIKQILIIASVGIILYLGAGFFAVFWLTYFSSPKRAESLPKEKILFAKLKKEYHLDEKGRSPETEHRLLTPKDTLTYILYLSGIDCVKNKKEADTVSLKIAQEINHLDLHPNFYKYEIILFCESNPPGELRYQFLRKNLQ